MKIEKFRTKKGLMIRALDKNDKALFKHCAGADTVRSSKQKHVIELLFLHGVYVVEELKHSSI